MAKIKIKKADLLEAIRATGGKTTGICERLNISRPTLGRYIADPEIAEAIEYAQVRLIDRAEYGLMQAVERGEKWAIELVLKDSRRGKERGYGNSLDVTSGGQALKVVFVDDTDNNQTPPPASDTSGG